MLTYGPIIGIRAEIFCMVGLGICQISVSTCPGYLHPDDEIDHDDTTNIVCPYCGYEDYDSWEVSPGQRRFRHN